MGSTITTHVCGGNGRSEVTDSDGRVVLASVIERPAHRLTISGDGPTLRAPQPRPTRSRAIDPAVNRTRAATHIRSSGRGSDQRAEVPRSLPVRHIARSATLPLRHRWLQNDRGVARRVPAPRRHADVPLGGPRSWSRHHDVLAVWRLLVGVPSASPVIPDLSRGCSAQHRDSQDVG